MYNNLDVNGRVGGISAKPAMRIDFDDALSFGPDVLGISRSEFVVMACVMLALDLGMCDKAAVEILAERLTGEQGK